MPSVSTPQARMMAAACKDPAVAERMGISQKAACEWHESDKALARQGKGALAKKTDSGHGSQGRSES